MTTTVGQILAGRTGVYMVSPDDTIFDALRLMADKNIGAVLVMSDGAIAGIVSERDYARRWFSSAGRRRQRPFARS